MRGRARHALGLALLLALASAARSAEQLRVQVPRGPHYVGTSIEIQVLALGLAEEPEPVCEAPAPARGRLRFDGLTPNVNTSVTIVNGKISRTRDVRFVCRFVFDAEQPGQVEIGPFRVSQGESAQTSPPVRLTLRAVSGSDRLGVVLRVPEEPVYVGQRVPVELEFRIDGELEGNLLGYELRAPFFAPSDGLRFLDPQPGEGWREIDVDAGDRTLQLSGPVRVENQGGRRVIVVTLRRTLVPLRSGGYTVTPSSVTADEGTRWRRDFFGRRATQMRKWRALDSERRLEVRELPERGMPPSFAGAVGRGFSLDVSADRSVVLVGEPITLSLRLRGDGNLETAALPRLDAEGLLPSRLFRVPEHALTGRIEDDVKEFSAMVRVLDEDVREIPELEYAWFDPEDGSYHTTRSRPIALSVRSSQVVGAADVVSDAGPGGEPAPQTIDGIRPAPERSTLPLTGADLAIERDPARLLAGARRTRGGPWVAGGLYAVGVLALGLAVLDRRRSEVDPKLRRRRAAIQADLERVRAAAARPEREAVGEIAGALRRIRAECPSAAPAELEAFLGECDARSYAPGDLADEGLDPGFHERAVSLAEAMADAVR
ncbi:MAG: BatD family protein [Myxococcota bacterium]|nr:BatD family protein [Myxococcota bacterium]